MRRLRPGMAALAAFADAAFAAATPAMAQTFPVAGKPLRIIVPFPAGGQTDVQARILAAKLQPVLGVPVLVDNKPGASTILGVQELLKAPADDHTILPRITEDLIANP